MAKKSEQPQKIYFYDLSKINIYAMCQNIRLYCWQFTLICYLTRHFQEIQFKLFEIAVLANFHDKYSQKSKNKLLYFYPFLFLKKNTMA